MPLSEPAMSDGYSWRRVAKYRRSRTRKRHVQMLECEPVDVACTAASLIGQIAAGD